ncbi:hypothetical protein JXA02_11570 [candidate division KSB1 bacterium]|nr:hypothetical protein [candidate division KSB1 bacterium]RQW02317.1 MAG: hypothetical protein EH222_13820 [candidate division KSB1 bacterium]
MMKKIFSLLCLSLSTVIYAAVGNWQTFTNTSEIREFAIADSMVWSATNGGILRVNVNTHDYNIFTNSEGLAQIDVVTIAHDPNGLIWIAMPDGLLQILDIESGEWDVYNEFQNALNVNCIVAQPDYVLVGFDKGIAELKLDAKQRWERSWKAEIGAVNAILIRDDYVWIGQNDGIRRIPIDFPNKQIPSAWEHFGVRDGLPGARVNDLAQQDALILAGTENGIGFYDADGWSNAELLNHNIKSLCTWQNRLAVTSNLGVMVQDAGNWITLGTFTGNCERVRATASGQLWLGTSDDGLYFWENGAWSAVSVNGPKSNTYSDLLVDRDGHLWATSSKNPTGGVYYFDGVKWTNFTRQTGLANYDYRTLAQDVFGRIWAGSWGGGVTLFEKVDGDSIAFTNLYAMDGHLSGVEGAENYVVITDLISDAQGNMWFLNSHSGNKQSLHVYDLDSSWQHWSSADGIRSVNVSCLEIDNIGRKWIGTGASNGMGANGVSVLDDNSSPFIKDDDDLSGFLDETEGLEGNNITALAEDLDGTMWIGTTKGLNYWFGTVGARYNVINDNIQALYVDPRNNKWIGTVGGLSVLDSDNFSWNHYTTFNSQLVSNFITSLAFDEGTGELYIGTTNGLSRFGTPFTKPASNLNAVRGYPNPFIVDPENSRFYIDNLALNSSVKIYTADGFLVREIPRSEILGARVSWDGTNDDGELVSSGVYIYLVTTKEGAATSGKIALVRQ